MDTLWFFYQLKGAVTGHLQAYLIKAVRQGKKLLQIIDRSTYRTFTYIHTFLRCILQCSVYSSEFTCTFVVLKEKSPSNSIRAFSKRVLFINLIPGGIAVCCTERELP